MSADLILKPGSVSAVPREIFVSVSIIGIFVVSLLVSRVSKLAAFLTAVSLALVFASFAVYREKTVSSDTVEDEKMMLRVLISRYGKYAFYLYRDPVILRSFFRALLYVNETVDPYVSESVVAFGKMFYYLLVLEKGYAGDTRDITYELDLLKREGFNALAGYEFSADPGSVIADDRTIQQLIEDLKPRVQQVLEHAKSLIQGLELSRIARDGINTKTNLMAIGPWYSYKPADLLEGSGMYS